MGAGLRGEKDCDRLAALGFVTTTNPMGAGKWLPEYAAMLQSRLVAIFPDNDPSGERHVEQVARSLSAVAAEIRIVRLPDLPSKGDASDWLDQGGTAHELRELIAGAPTWLLTSGDDGGGGSEDIADIEQPPEPWNPPLPLPEGERPEFPVSLLPDPLREFVGALAIEKQTPTALPALICIGVVATAAAKRARVAVYGNWSEPVNIFVLPASDSATRKSATVNAATKPLADFETARAEAMRVEIAQASSRRAVAEKKREARERDSARNTDATLDLGFESDLNDIVLKLETDPHLKIPIAPRLLVDDTTPEKAADMMADQGGRLAVISPEGGFFQTISGRYNDTDALDFVLKGHAGDDIPVDRMNREGKSLKAPALTLALAVQPEVLTGIARERGFRGRGFLARFAYAYPTSTIGQRQVNPPPPPVPERVSAAYTQLINRILALPEDEVAVLQMSDSARAAFLDFEASLEPRLGPDGDLEHIRDWGGKLAGLVARFAGLFHLVKYVTGGEVAGSRAQISNRQIEVETIAATIEIARTFLIPHAKTVFAAMGADPALEDAKRVLRAVQAWPDVEFSKRDLHQSKLKQRFARPDQLDRPLALLEEFGYVRKLPPPEAGRAGRPPSPRYEINPALTAQYPHNPQNPPSTLYSEDIEDIERSYGSENEDGDSEHARVGREPLVTIYASDPIPFVGAFDVDDWGEERAV